MLRADARGLTWMVPYPVLFFKEQNEWRDGELHPKAIKQGVGVVPGTKHGRVVNLVTLI